MLVAGPSVLGKSRSLFLNCQFSQMSGSQLCQFRHLMFYIAGPTYVLDSHGNIGSRVPIDPPMKTGR
jgi:hypothetical protein